MNPPKARFEISLETGSVLGRIALWDCFEGRILPSFLRNSVIANEKSDSDSPIVQFFSHRPSPPQSQIGLNVHTAIRYL